MMTSVRESKARLSELIAKATAGEEVLITVRGKPAVRLTPVSPGESQPDVKAWVERRRVKLRHMPESSNSSADILAALRDERF